jgi:hypothetical protein
MLLEANMEATFLGSRAEERLSPNKKAVPRAIQMRYENDFSGTRRSVSGLIYKTANHDRIPLSLACRRLSPGIRSMTALPVLAKPGSVQFDRIKFLMN